MKCRSVAVATAGLALVAAFPALAVEYDLTPLTTPHSYSIATSINNNGVVAGGAAFASGESARAAVWRGGTVTDLGTLGGFASFATAVNDSGQVAGYAYPAGSVITLGALWNGSTPTALGTLGGSQSYANGINNAGQVVGSATTTGDMNTHATLWDGGAVIDLNRGAQYTTHAVDINNSSQVAGYGYTWQGTRAIRWEGSTTTILGALGGNVSQSTAINDAGVMVGWSSLDNAQIHAVVWNGTTATDLGTLDGVFSAAYGVNNSGQVVGRSLLGTASHATLWDDGTLVDLNNYVDPELAAAGWVLTRADDINDAGAIVGLLENSNTRQYLAAVLTPVPEPATVAMLLAGLGWLSVVSRRRRDA